jgi:hypothetical protein
LAEWGGGEGKGGTEGYLGREGTLLGCLNKVLARSMQGYPPPPSNHKKTRDRVAARVHFVQRLVRVLDMSMEWFGEVSKWFR